MKSNDSTSKTQDGLFKLGYVANLRNGAYIKELQDLLNGTEEEPTSQEIRERVNNAEILYLNWNGYQKDSEGNNISEEAAVFRAFESGYKTTSGKSIFGWFEKNKDTGTYMGVSWGTLEQLQASRYLKTKFHMGDFYFENKDACEAFLDKIATNTIPESWAFNNKQSEINHPILKSYLENIFIKLEREGKILRSANGKYILFNTNLLNRFFKPLYIIAEVKNFGGLEVYVNPIHTSPKSNYDLIIHGFKGMNPEPPVFFSDVDEVIFNTSWDIDTNDNSLTHIIDKRIERFPQQYRGMSSYELAKKIDDAIGSAIAIAQRNYKYIVPIYYPRFDSISFLMPIFLNGLYSESPDFALVLQTDREHNIYIARTILDIESGYQDARLIAKPDESWFNLAKLVKK